MLPQSSHFHSALLPPENHRAKQLPMSIPVHTQPPILTQQSAYPPLRLPPLQPLSVQVPLPEQLLAPSPPVIPLLIKNATNITASKQAYSKRPTNVHLSVSFVA